MYTNLGLSHNLTYLFIKILFINLVIIFTEFN